jgi:chromate reductase
MTLTIGYFVGSLAANSINRTLANALVRLAPASMRFEEIPIGNLPLYNRDLDANYPPEAQALKDAIARADGVLFVTPEYNRDIPGALKNAIDWASRPWGTNSFNRKPSGTIGASPGKLGTAIAQQNLKAVLSFCNSPQFNSLEAYVQLAPGDIEPDGAVNNDELKVFLQNYLSEFEAFIRRVLTVLPRE